MKTTSMLVCLLGTLLFSACASSATPTITADRPATAPATPRATDTPASRPTVTSEPVPPEPEGTVPPAEARRLMDDMISGGPATLAAIEQVRATGDERFIAVFIELLRAAQIGLIEQSSLPPTLAALESLSGQPLAGDWPGWVEWYGTTDLSPPPGFTGWKGRLLSRIDPGFGEFLREEWPSRIRVEEIQWGGVRVDGIPALDNPRTLEADKATFLEPGEPVFGVDFNGEARAYPLRILDWHEMANDVVGGVPFSLAYCTLCGAAIAYDGRASDGQTYTFGSSGFLYRSNKLMYDRQTRTLWNQLTGEPVLGELAGSDPLLELTLLPVVLTSWREWQNQHPDTSVVDIDTGYQRVYLPGAAYGGYFAAEDTMFPVWQRGEALPDKAQIYAMRIDGVPKAYPLETLLAERVVNDTLAGTPLVLVAGEEAITVEGTSLRDGQVTYQAGGEVRAYQRGEATFRPGSDPGTVLDSSGRPWEITEAALVGPGGERAPRLSGHLAYWFGWYAFFPQTQVYQTQANGE